MTTLVGIATGPKTFVKELGIEVPTFDIDPGGVLPALKYHVPLEFRGDFRPIDLANYDPTKEYRTDAIGRVLCYGTTKSGSRCTKRAVNRSPRCEFHGGRLHPLDKIAKDDEKASDTAEAESLSRYRQFQAGQITVDDLDDEELAACGFRAKNGTIYKPRNVPRALAEGFTRAIYARAESEIRSLAIEAAQTIGEIMKNRTNEPDIRLKAAMTLIERNLGKTPQVLAITDAKAYEEVFDSIQHVRSEREPRAIESANVIDAEVVGGEQQIDYQPNAQGDKGFGNTAESIDVEPDNGSTGGQVVSDPGYVAQSNPEPGRDEQPRDARLYERNEAVLAQTLEIKPFEYDLEDHQKDIKKATQKRYASRVLGVDLTERNVPMVRHIKKTNRGTLLIRHTEPVMPKVPKAIQNAASKRKSFTLNDFH